MDFRIEKTDASGSRAGLIDTAHGQVRTPVFMPVATRAAIRALTLRELEEINFDIILSNTYHLYIRPGLDVLTKAEGLHRFMNFSRPILTDSGGFQVFSLADLCRVRENGVEFRSHIDGSLHFFSPEKVLDIQGIIGSDIMMVLDQCTEYPAEEKAVSQAVQRTVSWAGDSIRYWKHNFDAGQQSLFAIVQGGVYPDLRKECGEQLVALEFPGYAIGGLSVGEPKDLYQEITSLTSSLLPADKPRYMMGVGSPMEILYAVKCGVDMFDCVMPTRIARNGTLYTSQGRINIKAAPYEDDFSPLDPECSCYVCRNFSRAYLRHIFRMGEIAALVYNTYHNLYFMKKFMEDVRESILQGAFSSFYRRAESIFGQGKNS
ncbi:MAG TPA: tRNA guanosine(34) transglycosylase Tgt [Spirochaetota bacterium]|nr:tRNA guanosine(34) transglycosylase Tgt [Spirochaetota bacterium]HPI88606.1 tRNA guanosine(34) transglycosylase Tgt [Spirochaetota bacterium]HPR48247.1 tRNA guanosine(34) transglycosylase Tgt [Spirochaetota bacterium]